VKRVIVYMFFPLLVAFYLVARACGYLAEVVIEVHKIVEEKLNDKNTCNAT